MKVKDTIDRYAMVVPGDRVVVAVSGGPDSVCLLDVLHRLREDLNVDLVVAHFEHGFRPGEDEVETAFVAALAEGYGIPFEQGRGKGLHPQMPSLEERARVERHRFLEEVRAKSAAKKIALGHQMEDQAETVILHLLRGSGPSGLAGIPASRGGTLIRPLIRVSRGEIENYLKDRSLLHVTDSSNLDLRHRRNWVRHDVLPRMQFYQPRLAETLGRTAEILSDDEDYLRQQAKAWVQEMSHPREGRGIELPLRGLMDLHKALAGRVIRQVLHALRGDLRKISHGHIEAVLRLMHGSRPQAHLDLPDRMVVERVYGTMVFYLRTDASEGDFAYLLNRPGTYHLESPGCTLVLEELDASGLQDLKAVENTALMDAARLIYPLLARNFRPGDRFIPLGMQGQKKVKDFFSDLKVPSLIRRSVPILISRDHPIWICGFRIDDRVKVTRATRCVLRASVLGLDLDRQAGLSPRTEGRRPGD